MVHQLAAVSIEISVKSMWFDDIRRKIVEKIEGIPGLVELKDDYVIAKPEIVVNVDSNGRLCSPQYSDYRSACQSRNPGNRSGCTEGNDEYDIVRLPEERRRSVFPKNLVISDPEEIIFRSVPWRRLRYRRGWGRLSARSKKVITIQGDAEGRSPARFCWTCRRLANLELPRGYNIRSG